MMNRKSLIPLAFTIWVASAELTVTEDKPSEAISQCLLHIINEYFRNSKKISIRYNDDQQKKILEELLVHTNNPIMVNVDEYPRNMDLDDRLPSDTSIILSEDVNVTEYLQRNLYSGSTVFFTVFWRKREEIERIFGVFWYYNIVNAYALEVQEDEVYVHEYTPYVKCDINEPILLDKWSEGGFRYGRIDRIRKKAPIMQVNGCTLVVAVPNVPPTIIFPDLRKLHGTNFISGLEGKIWMTVAEKINSTFRYKVPDDGKFWGFAVPPTGAIGELMQKKSHFAGGGPTVTLNRVSHLETIVGTSGVSDTVIWVVPKGAAKNHPVWLRIFTVEFSSLTWVCLAMILALTIVTHSAFSHFTKTSFIYGLFDSFLVLFSASLRASVKMPDSLPLKVLIAFWMWYTMIIMTAYESVMRSTLTVPIRHHEVNTQREVVESGIDLYGIDTTIKVVLIGANDPCKEAMAKKVRVWNSSLEEIMDRVSKDRKSGYMREKLTVDYFLYNHKELIGSIHLVKEPIHLYYQSMYMQKRFPLFRRVQSIVSHLRDSGITAWWRTEYNRESYQLPTKAVKLTTEHMTATFTILGVGSMLATIAFVAEHNRYRRKLKRKAQRKKSSQKGREFGDGSRESEVQNRKIEEGDLYYADEVIPIRSHKLSSE